MPVKKENLERLEERLNLIQTDIETLDADIVEEDSSKDSLPDTLDDFNLDNLKTDYITVRNTLLKQIKTGQDMLDSISILDPGDFSSGQLMAISDLQKTITQNLKTLINLYKDILDIKKRHKELNQKNNTDNNSDSKIVNNNLFVGSSKDLLKLIEEQSKK